MLDAEREFHHVSREIKVGFLLTWLSAYPTCFSVLVCVFRIASWGESNFCAKSTPGYRPIASSAHAQDTHIRRHLHSGDSWGYVTSLSPMFDCGAVIGDSLQGSGGLSLIQLIIEFL